MALQYPREIKTYKALQIFYTFPISAIDLWSFSPQCRGPTEGDDYHLLQNVLLDSQAWARCHLWAPCTSAITRRVT